MRAHVHFAPSAKRLDEDEVVGRAVAFVFVVYPHPRTRLGRDALACFFDELPGLLAHAHNRTGRIIGTFIDFEHVFHICDKLRVLLGRD